MAEQSDVVNRADALMRRRRSFVAATVSEPALAVVSPQINEDDDLPVLTEIVAAEPSVEDEKKDHFDETQVSIIASEIAHTIEQQMSYELPTLVEAALLSACEELRAGITSTVESALRDFIARRKQLHLPLDEPNQDV